MNDEKELIYEFKQMLKKEIQAEMTAQDAETMQLIANQHCRLFKLFCWLWFDHLYRDGVCVRCGAKQRI